MKSQLTLRDAIREYLFVDNDYTELEIRPIDDHVIASVSSPNFGNDFIHVNISERRYIEVHVHGSNAHFKAIFINSAGSHTTVSNVEFSSFDPCFFDKLDAIIEWWGLHDTLDR